MKNKIIFFIEIVLLLILAGCSDIKFNQKFDAEEFESDLFNAEEFESDLFTDVLCVDLRIDNNPKFGLIINNTTKDSLKLRTLILPFRIKDGSYNKRLLNSYGIYPDFTIINYYTNPDFHSLNLSFSPLINSDFEEPIIWDNIDNNINFLKVGQKRWFIYKNTFINQKNISNLINHSLDAIAVSIPPNAEGREIKNSMTDIPAPDYDRGKTKLFSFKKINSEPKKMLQVKYELPPTSKQKYLMEFGTKLLIAIIMPIIALAIIPRNKIVKYKRWKLILIIGIVVQCFLLLALVYWGIKINSTESLKQISDISIAIIGGILTLVVLKQNKENN